MKKMNLLGVSSGAVLKLAFTSLIFIFNDLGIKSSSSPGCSKTSRESRAPWKISGALRQKLHKTPMPPQHSFKIIDHTKSRTVVLKVVGAPPWGADIVKGEARVVNKKRESITHWWMCPWHEHMLWMQWWGGPPWNVQTSEGGATRSLGLKGAVIRSKPLVLKIWHFLSSLSLQIHIPVLSISFCIWLSMLPRYIQV